MVKIMMTTAKQNNSIEGSRTFNYMLNDRNAKKKILQGAKRIPFEIDENQSSDTFIFSAGAWLKVVVPFVMKLQSEIGKSFTVKGDNVRVASVNLGKDASDMKYVDAKVEFLAGKGKITCHFYNTTQRILINGHGYKNLSEFFLKPFFVCEIDNHKDDIPKANIDIIEQFDLKNKSVKRSSVKFSGRSSISCNKCDHVSKSFSALNKHKQINHSIQNISFKAIPDCPTSTRNNSMNQANVMNENLTLEETEASVLENDCEILEEIALKFTCTECNYSSMRKTDLDKHVILHHQTSTFDEANYECKQCGKELEGENEFKSHILNHEADVEKSVIVANQLRSDVGSTVQFSCPKCEHISNTDEQLKSHIQIHHMHTLVDILPSKLVSCDYCEFTCDLNIKLKKHIQRKHTTSIQTYQCEVCDFQCNYVTTMWKHSWNNHKEGPKEAFTDEQVWKLVAEQNVDLSNEIDV